MCYNSVMKKHSLWLIEFVVWISVVVFTILGIHYYQAVKVNSKNTYHIFLKDIDGLMKGSPVKIMGVQVGYVTEINVIDDYMYVSFLIIKPDVAIPQGATALIESYGIAGSKSIELYPPKEKADKTQALLFVKDTIRASSSFKTQNMIAKTLIAVSEGTTAMLDTQTVSQHKQNIQKLTELSGYDGLNLIDEKSDEIINIMQKDIKSKTKNKKEEGKDE